MKEIQKIIVPVDFLEHTDQLAEYALYIAKQFSASLKFIHIIEPPYDFGNYECPSSGEFTLAVEKHSKRKMERLLKKYKEVCPDCQGTVLQGNIVDSIIKHAETEKAELIIIGTHGRKGLEKMWLGSVAERVIKTSSCPTLTCNPYKGVL